MGIDQAKWIASKKLVNDRDGGLCVVCGREAEAVHHRQVRGQGGSSDPDRNYGMANLISLCAFHHAEVHDNPESSYQNGLLVHSWDTPARQPVSLQNDAILIYFGNDGTVRKLEQETLF